MSLYILSDKKIDSFLPARDDKDALAALTLNQKRVKTKMLTNTDQVYNLKNDPNAILYITATLSPQYYKIIEYCNNNNLPVICAHQPQANETNYTYSTIRGNTIQVIKSLLAYSEYYNKTKPAFFALYHGSSHDRKKASIVYDVCENFTEDDVYSVDGGFDECLNSFYENRHKYDIIFCSNDFSAIALVEDLKQRDPEYLNDVFIVGFMDTILSKLYSPSITTCSYDTNDVAKALLNIYRIYYKNNHVSSIDIALNSHISTRQSTHSLPIDSAEITQLCGKYKSKGRVLNFNKKNKISITLSSPVIGICKKLEAMLTNFKPIDFQILSKLLENKHNNEICDEIFISMQTLQYHLKKMISSLDVNSKSEFIKIVSKYISLENLKSYIAQQ